MHLIEELYLGWQPLSHTPDCPRPTWDVVETRSDEGARIVAMGAERHTCANDICTHGNVFGRVQLRLLCHDCGTVRIVTGEGLTHVVSSVSATGWGQAPREVHGVWLWPGQPAIDDGDPHDYLVTREHAETVTTDNLHGIITGYRDASGTQRWIAAAQLDPEGAHQVHTLRWRHSSNGLADVDAAAAWIASADTRTPHPLVVAV
ncbi:MULTISPECIES: hypothetical protein [Streptomyces]